jgi:CheY-like chemotaxis protein
MLNQPDDRLISYPPSILIVADKTPQGLELKQTLEAKGYQVHLTDPSPKGLAAAFQSYFELIVLNFERLDPDRCEAWRKISAAPELARTPMVILTGRASTPKAIDRLESVAPVYYLSKDNTPEEKLPQIVEQAHYMKYRYM